MIPANCSDFKHIATDLLSGNQGFPKHHWEYDVQNEFQHYTEHEGELFTKGGIIIKLIFWLPLRQLRHASKSIHKLEVELSPTWLGRCASICYCRSLFFTKPFLDYVYAAFFCSQLYFFKHVPMRLSIHKIWNYNMDL